MTKATKGRAAAAVCVTVIFTIAAAGTVWLLAGLTESDLTDPDYAVRPVKSLVAARTTIGLVALAVGLGCVALLIRLKRLGAPSNWRVVAPIAGIGIVVGGTYAVATTPVYGANIGFGLVILAAPVAVAVLVALAVRAGGAWQKSRE